MHPFPPTLDNTQKCLSDLDDSLVLLLVLPLSLHHLLFGGPRLLSVHPVRLVLCDQALLMCGVGHGQDGVLADFLAHVDVCLGRLLQLKGVRVRTSAVDLGKL